MIHCRKAEFLHWLAIKLENEDQFAVGEKNPDQLKRYIENGSFCVHHLEPHQRYYKHANRDYLDWAVTKGFLASDVPLIFQLYSEPMQKFRLSAQGHGARQPPQVHRARIERYFDPLPFWYEPFEGAMVSAEEFPFFAITQRPMHMYHSWGSQNAWLRQITNANKLYMNKSKAESMGLQNDDWVWISSYIGRVKAQVQLQTGVNPNTVWTWNAIGKRKGAWNLDPDAPEARQGFLLNHLISELLPDRGAGYRYSNSDPITGQAAWYDLKVKIEKAEPAKAGETTLPQFEAFANPLHHAVPQVSNFGAEFLPHKNSGRSGK